MTNIADIAIFYLAVSYKKEKCKTILPFRINSLGVSCTVGQHTLYYGEQLDRIATADGFKDWRDMCMWFSETHGLPFEGVLITWLK